MKYLLIVAVAVFLSTGCVATKLFVPDVSNRLESKELTHLKDVNVDYNKTLLALADKDKIEDKTKLNFAKLALKGNKEVTDVRPSAIGQVANAYVGNVAREKLDEQIKTGISWSSKLISQVAGGGVAGGGGLAYLIALLRRKSKALNVVNAELSPEEKAKVKKAMNHTGLEKEVV